MSLFFVILSGILLSLPFLNGHLWLLAFFGFVPLFLTLSSPVIASARRARSNLSGVASAASRPRNDKTRAFFYSYLTGIIFWSATIYWLIHVTLVGQILLILYLALYFGFFGLFLSTLHPAPCTLHLFSVPAFWVFLEYLRSHLFTGFGWALLGYSQYLNLPIIQIADVFGAYGVSFLVMMVNVTIWKLLRETRNQSTETRKKEKRDISSIIWFLVTGFWLLVSLGYGFFRLHQKIEGPTVKISVIQGNIPQELKWEPGAKPYILDRYLILTEEAAKDKPDLLIWPEAASPGFLGEDDWVFEAMYDLAKRVNIPILVGTVVRENQRYYNSAILIDGQGKIANRYDKLHLVPFGEYIPLKGLLGFLETIVPIGSFTPGMEYVIFKLPAPSSQLPATFATLICFEDTIPELSREFAQRGVSFLVNITNDGWYKETQAPYQHLMASVFRAVENRLPLVRSANTGVSCFIDSRGRIKEMLADNRGKIFIAGFKTVDIVLDKNFP